MPGPCGGPDCRSEGKRRGKGEHANNWCCSKSACRRAMGIVESEADKKAREEAALAAAAAAAAAAAGAEGAPAPPAVPVPAAARAAPTRSRPSDAEAHYRAWCKMMAGRSSPSGNGARAEPTCSWWRRRSSSRTETSTGTSSGQRAPSAPCSSAARAARARHADACAHRAAGAHSRGSTSGGCTEPKATRSRASSSSSEPKATRSDACGSRRDACGAQHRRASFWRGPLA